MVAFVRSFALHFASGVDHVLNFTMTSMNPGENVFDKSPHSLVFLALLSSTGPGPTGLW